MIISYRHRFIFVKTRKTAGSSIQLALSGLCGDEDIIVCDQTTRNVERSFSRNPHASLSQVKLAVPEDAWTNFLKFAFVRNPWDLAVSRYHWERKGLECSVADFTNWVRRYTSDECLEPERHPHSNNIVQHVWEGPGGYLRDQQSRFVLDGGVVGVQFIGRYERLKHDFVAICERLALSAPALPQLKGGFRSAGSYRDWYDAGTKSLVASAFAEDISRFEFRF